MAVDCLVKAKYLFTGLQQTAENRRRLLRVRVHKEMRQSHASMLARRKSYCGEYKKKRISQKQKKK